MKKKKEEKLKAKVAKLRRQLKAWKTVRKQTETTWYYRKGK